MSADATQTCIGCNDWDAEEGDDVCLGCAEVRKRSIRRAEIEDGRADFEYEERRDMERAS